jgi:hypothetical protein
VSERVRQRDNKIERQTVRENRQIDRQAYTIKNLGKKCKFKASLKYNKRALKGSIV